MDFVALQKGSCSWCTQQMVFYNFYPFYWFNVIDFINFCHKTIKLAAKNFVRSSQPFEIDRAARFLKIAFGTVNIKNLLWQWLHF